MRADKACFSCSAPAGLSDSAPKMYSPEEKAKAMCKTTLWPGEGDNKIAGQGKGASSHRHLHPGKAAAGTEVLAQLGRTAPEV